MSIYKSLLNQIEDLRSKAEDARLAEKDEVIADIKARMKEFGITLAELTIKQPSHPKVAPVPIKYMDPSSGKTWTGRGRAPFWFANAIASGKKVEVFLIDEVDRS